tara:strand:+ start:551 stop:874 length:324 start_codon:yes stop_codon:yes gene_type:complete
MIKINLENNIQNSSLQVKDIAYYVTLSGKFGNDPIKIGEITQIGPDYIKIENVASMPSSNDFIMFSKNKSVNNSSLLGYYAEVKLTNDSDKKAELFALGSEVSESSK